MATVARTGKGRWQARWYTGRRDANGKLERATRVVYARTRAEAMAEATLLEQKAQRRGRAITLAEAHARWLAQDPKRQAGTRSTEEAERRARLHILPRLGQLDLIDLDAATLEDFYAELGRPIEQGGKGLSAGTVRHVHWDISGTLKMAVRRGELDRAVTEDVELSPLDRRPVELPSLADLSTLLARAEELAASSFPVAELRIAIMLAICTGARVGELCALRWADVSEGFAVIQASVSEPGGKTVLKQTKTGSVRRVPLPDAMASALIAHRARASATFPHETVGPSAFIFASTGPRPFAGPIAPSRLKGRWDRLKKQCGVDCRFHDLRHFAVSTWIDGGVAIAEASKLAGHARVSTTTDIYLQLARPIDRRAARVIEAAVRELGTD